MAPVETRTAKIFLDDDGILHIVMRSGVMMDYEDAIDNYLVVRNLCRDKKIVKLIDSRLPWRIEKKARLFLDRKEIRDQTIARAVVTATEFERVLAGFLAAMRSSPVPVRVFTDPDEARAWLLEMKNSAV